MSVQVSVCVIAYNHEHYIVQCLESILRQRTSFDFEVLVRDDASTDGTRRVLQAYKERYPDRVRLVLERKNTWNDPDCKPVIGRILAPLARGRYLASCEGDDYWTDDTKLQRQFDYMEAHPECVLCSHITEIVRDDGGISTKRISFGNTDRDIACDEIMENWAKTQRYGISSLHPSSCFTRKDAELAYASSWRIHTSAGDYVRACFFSHQHSVHFMARAMSAYRYMAAQSWTTTAECDSSVLAGHYREFLEMTSAIDKITNFAHHDAAMRGCKQRALLLAGMTQGWAFFHSGIGAPIKPYLFVKDWAILATLRVLNALGLRPARDTATGRVKLGRYA